MRCVQFHFKPDTNHDEFVISLINSSRNCDIVGSLVKHVRVCVSVCVCECVCKCEFLSFHFLRASLWLSKRHLSRHANYYFQFVANIKLRDWERHRMNWVSATTTFNRCRCVECTKYCKIERYLHSNRYSTNWTDILFVSIWLFIISILIFIDVRLWYHIVIYLRDKNYCRERGKKKTKWKDQCELWTSIQWIIMQKYSTLSVQSLRSTQSQFNCLPYTYNNFAIWLHCKWRII